MSGSKLPFQVHELRPASELLPKDCEMRTIRRVSRNRILAWEGCGRPVGWGYIVEGVLQMMRFHHL